MGQCTPSMARLPRYATHGTLNHIYEAESRCIRNIYGLLAFFCTRDNASIRRTCLPCMRRTHTTARSKTRHAACATHVEHTLARGRCEEQRGAGTRAAGRRRLHPYARYVLVAGSRHPPTQAAGPSRPFALVGGASSRLSRSDKAPTPPADIAHMVVRGRVGEMPQGQMGTGPGKRGLHPYGTLACTHEGFWVGGAWRAHRSQ